jgi:hypothetical protein
MKAMAQGSGKRQSHICLVQVARVWVRVYLVRFGKVVELSPSELAHPRSKKSGTKQLHFQILISSSYKPLHISLYYQCVTKLYSHPLPYMNGPRRILNFVPVSGYELRPKAKFQHNLPYPSNQTQPWLHCTLINKACAINICILLCYLIRENKFIHRSFSLLHHMITWKRPETLLKRYNLTNLFL